MRAGRHDAAMVHDENHVGFLHGGHTLGDDDLRGVGNLMMECGANQLIGFGVDRGRGIVENKDLRLFQQRTRNAQTLALTAGNVGTALFDVRIVLVGEFLNEAVGLRKLACVTNLFISGVRIAPTQVFGNGSGEQHVLLQYHGDLIAQYFQIVIAHIHAADLQRAFGHVIQTWHKLHQTGLCGTGAADDADGHTGTDLQINIVKHRLFGSGGITEGDMVEINLTILHFHNRIFRIRNRAFLVQHLADTLGGSLRNNAHHENHGQHHHGHEDLHGVSDQCGQIAGGQTQGRIVAGRHDLLGTHPGDKQHGHVHAQHHERIVEAHNAFGLGEVLEDALGNAVELFGFVVFAIVRLDHADALQVLVYHVVELVVRVEHALEHRMHQYCQTAQADGEHRNAGEEHQRNGWADAEGEDPRHNHHDRSAHTHADDH